MGESYDKLIIHINGCCEWISGRAFDFECHITFCFSVIYYVHVAMRHVVVLYTYSVQGLGC